MVLAKDDDEDDDVVHIELLDLVLLSSVFVIGMLANL